MPVVIRPSANDGIERANQVLLSRGFVSPDDVAHLAPNSSLRVFRRHDQKFVLISADVEPEKVKPFCYVCDLRLFRREREVALRKERFHFGFRLFQQID